MIVIIVAGASRLLPVNALRDETLGSFKMSNPLSASYAAGLRV